MSVPAVHTSSPVPSSVTPVEPWPAGVVSANTFQLFNSLSWQICLGAPVILYAKSQGASATLLGLIASLAPLMVIFQIPAAHLLPRLGYKRLILAGWGARTAVVFALAAVPMLVMFTGSVRLGLVVACLTLFNVFRGIASGAWMPWICEWIPESLRGRFLSRDQMFGNVGSLAALLTAAAVLGGTPAAWQFSLVFLLSACSATISLFFVRHIPDAVPAERRRQSGTPVPWLHMLRWPPFYRLLTFSLVYVVAAGGLGVFTVSYLRGVEGYAESTVLLFTALGIVGAMLTVRGVGHLVDHGGNRLALGGCMLSIGLIAAGWFALAAGLLPRSVWLAAGLNFLLGATSVNYFVANSRMAMATFPLMGRNHFFAMFSVITSLALGLAPVAWGLLIDTVGDATATTGPITWTRYGAYFLTVATIATVGSLATARLLSPHPQSQPPACAPTVPATTP